MENKQTKSDKVNFLEETFIKGQIYKDVYSKKEVWKKLEQLFNGKLKIKHTINKDITSFQLDLPYKNHKLIITESDTKPLKFEIEFKLNKNFEFNISWEDTIEKILKVFGKQDIQINDKQFDKKYLIQSTDSDLITDLLNCKSIKNLILKYNIYLINFEYNEKKKNHKLLTVKDRNTKDINKLIELISLEFSIIDFFIKHKHIAE